MTTAGDALAIGGNWAQGDLTGAGGAGGLATSVGFSGAPLRTRPFPEARTLGLTDGEAAALVDEGAVGAGDFDFGCDSGSATDAGAGAGLACSSTCGNVTWVPSVHVMVSGAHSSSSSMSAQFA